MRVIARRMGAPYTLCEVLLDQFVNTADRSKRNQRRLRVTDEEHPVGGQLMGANPDEVVVKRRPSCGGVDRNAFSGAQP